MPDFYELLDVPRDADAKVIKSSYRKLALRFHPDRNPGDAAAEERFKEINEAYAVLSDPERRARYDRYGDADPAATAFSGDIFDIFASVFGGGMTGRRGGRPPRGVPGEDLETELEVTLEQARAGETVPVEIDRLVACERCGGERAEPGGPGRRSCETCGGAGQVRAQAQSFFGTVLTTQTCPRCRGLGEVIVSPCTACRGAGRQGQRASVDVQLPRGIDGGYRLRVPQAGNAGVDGGAAGDLYVYIQMAPHELLERDGDDLRCELRIGFAQAALGSRFSVPTLDGDEELEVRAGTQSGTEVRLTGRGMPRLRHSGSGDQIVTIVVETPRRLSGKARSLLQAYAEEVGEGLDEPETLGDRVRGLFGGRRRKAAAEGDEGGPADDEVASRDEGGPSRDEGGPSRDEEGAARRSRTTAA
jgi:molecular chaperone DnaJ